MLAVLTARAARLSVIFHSPGTELDHIYSRIYLTDYNTAWQAALEALKRFDKTVQNRQGGILETVWLDNTTEKNFIDSFGGDATYLNARYRIKFAGKPAVLRFQVNNVTNRLDWTILGNNTFGYNTLRSFALYLTVDI